MDYSYKFNKSYFTWRDNRSWILLSLQVVFWNFKGTNCYGELM